MLTGRTVEWKCIFIQFHAGAAFSSVRATFEKIPYRIFSKAARFLENGGRRAENAYVYGFGCINIHFSVASTGRPLGGPTLTRPALRPRQGRCRINHNKC